MSDVPSPHWTLFSFDSDALRDFSCFHAMPENVITSRLAGTSQFQGKVGR